MRQLKTGKALGLDGLLVEFYRAFWDCLKEDLVQMVNEVNISGSFSSSQRTSVIRLLYKGGDCKSLSSWRPISLLNTDYRIISRALANRLKHVLPQLIYLNQTCCILKRTISDNCAIVRDIIQHCEAISLD